MAARNNTTLDDISAIIGFTPTMRLVAFYGGCNIYIPPSPTKESEIAKLIGLSCFMRLAAEYGNDWVFIPNLSSFDEDRRRGMIWNLLRRGIAIQEIARYVNMSDRRIHQVRKELEYDGLLAMVLKEKPIEQFTPALPDIVPKLSPKIEAKIQGKKAP